jgi:hypothetical protein
VGRRARVRSAAGGARTLTLESDAIRVSVPIVTCIFANTNTDLRVADLLRTISHEVPLHIRLTRKLASTLDGIDLSEVKVGDVIYLAVEHAVMLIREGWAERVDR